MKQLGANVTFAASRAGIFTEIRQLAGIHTKVLQYSSRSTMVKTRVTTGNQLHVRYDSGWDDAITGEMEGAFIALLRQQYPLYDAVMITDHDKGMITPAVISALQARTQAGITAVTLDEEGAERRSY